MFRFFRPHPLKNKGRVVKLPNPFKEERKKAINRLNEFFPKSDNRGMIKSFRNAFLKEINSATNDNKLRKTLFNASRVKNSIGNFLNSVTPQSEGTPLFMLYGPPENGNNNRGKFKSNVNRFSTTGNLKENLKKVNALLKRWETIKKSPSRLSQWELRR